MKELKVDLGERSYPIYIGTELLGRSAEFFGRHGCGKGSPVLVVTDESVAPHYLPRVSDSLRSGGYTVAEAVVPAGETSKSLQVWEDVMSTALKAGLDRRSTVVALGGGVVGDMAGFVAASYMRGVRFVQMPTTIQAHDSSVGGKVGINHPLAKNIIGAFHQPAFVLYDTATLRTLPMREVRAGLAELAKEGLIGDAAFAAWCEAHMAELLRLDPDALAHGLHEGCRIKAAVVAGDERESGLRAILNLGHTFGHAFEAVGGYGGLLHGEAISIGMVGAARLALRYGRPTEIYERTKALMKAIGTPTRLPEHYDIDLLMEAMSHDKKFVEGRMTFIVPVAIGEVEIVRDVPADWVREIMDELKRED